ncbi:MAG TPA: PhzF family phenazine biosynthesis protein [Chitinophagales bacterium]|nr:PhzF family phenazine biosynthesis protein [Chitinophagales bacterium]
MLKIYQIDAFTNQVFKGNPAAVVPLEKWLPTEIMQQIAAENNLAETAFFVKENDAYHIKWFTPTVEIELCGHATLATAFVIYNYLNYDKNDIHFTCMVGDLFVTRDHDFITLNFPAIETKSVAIPTVLAQAIGTHPIAFYDSKSKFIALLEDDDAVQNAQPDFTLINQLEKSLIITAKGKDVDFVSRFFAPQLGVNEDPVTGSAHCVLIPFWSKKLNKTELTAMQLSQRTGFLKCKYLSDRVEMSGQAICYLIGDIFI